MKRSLFASLLGLTLAIGMTVGTLAWRTATFDRTLPELATSDPAVGQAFYAGVNQVLESGDRSALERAVTADFLDHSSGSDNPLSIELLGDQLATFSASFPGTRIEVKGIQASASSLVVTIAPIAPPPVAVAGISMTVPPIASGYEVLRVRNGKVAERWSSGLPDVATTTFADAAFTAGASGNMSIRLERVELPEGAQLAWRPGRVSVVLVESGAVRLHRSWTRQHEHEEDLTTLDTGTTLLIPSNMSVRLESATNEPVRLLVFAMWPMTPTDIPTLTVTGEVSDTLLWASNLPLPTHGKWSVSFGTIHVPAQTEVTLEKTSEFEVLLSTENSSAELVTEDGEVKSLSADLTEVDRANYGHLDPGQSAHVQDAKSIELRNTGDVDGAVWLVTIALVDSEATPVA